MAEPGTDRPMLAGRRITILNWRDSAHPRAGGAEVFCHEVAARLVAAGAVVELLTARVAGAPRREDVGGVRVRRSGGTFTVYPAVLARLFLRRVVRRRLDLVLDCQNGIPFFAPLAVGPNTPVVGLIFHVHQEQFALHFPAGMARLGRWLEGPVSRRVYGTRPVLVISPSTRAAVRRRLRLRGPLYVVPCGATPGPADPTPGPGTRLSTRSERPRIVCVGRLVPHKRVELLLDSLGAVTADHPDLDVHIIGSGPSRDALERLSDVLGLRDRVTFHGWLSAGERDALLATAWLTVNTSAGEGWGLSVIEANSAGLPSVCLDVDGLRDSVVEGRTGWVARTNQDLPGVISYALRLLSDENIAAGYRARAMSWARTFSWDLTADLVSRLLVAEAQRLAIPTERRRRSDLALRAEFAVPAGTADPEPGRLTDRWAVSEGRLTCLLYGLDEADFDRVVHRLGLPAPLHVRVARSHDLLLPPGSVLPALTEVPSGTAHVEASRA